MPRAWTMWQTTNDGSYPVRTVREALCSEQEMPRFIPPPPPWPEPPVGFRCATGRPRLRRQGPTALRFGLKAGKRLAWLARIELSTALPCLAKYAGDCVEAALLSERNAGREPPLSAWNALEACRTKIGRFDTEVPQLQASDNSTIAAFASLTAACRAAVAETKGLGVATVSFHVTEAARLASLACAIEQSNPNELRQRIHPWQSSRLLFRLGECVAPISLGLDAAALIRTHSGASPTAEVAWDVAVERRLPLDALAPEECNVCRTSSEITVQVDAARFCLSCLGAHLQLADDWFAPRR